MSLPKGFLKNSRDLSPLPEGMRSLYLRSKKFRKWNSPLQTITDGGIGKRGADLFLGGPWGGQSGSGVKATRQRESFPSFLKSHSHRENLPNGIRTSNLRSPMTPARPRDHALKRALSRTSESSVF